MRTRPIRGFTMVELIVAMAIIGVLIGIFLPNLRRAVAKSDVAACQSNLRNISTSIILYSNDNDRYYPATLSVTTPRWLKAIPTCPAAHADTYSSGYDIVGIDEIANVASTTATFTISCKGTNHSEVGLGVDQPWYSVAKGIGP